MHRLLFAAALPATTRTSRTIPVTGLETRAERVASKPRRTGALTVSSTGDSLTASVRIPAFLAVSGVASRTRTPS